LGQTAASQCWTILFWCAGACEQRRSLWADHLQVAIYSSRHLAKLVKLTCLPCDRDQTAMSIRTTSCPRCRSTLWRSPFFGKFCVPKQELLVFRQSPAGTKNRLSPGHRGFQESSQYHLILTDHFLKWFRKCLGVSFACGFGGVVGWKKRLVRYIQNKTLWMISSEM